MSPEKQEDLENLESKQKENEEIKQWLENFWKNPEADQKNIDNQDFWNKAVSMMQEDIKKKLESINDPETKEKMEWLSKEMKWYCKLWKLDNDQMKELSYIYKEIESLNSTEAGENTQRDKDIQTNNEKDKNDYTKLLEVTEKLHDFMKGNHDKKMSEQETKLKEAEKRNFEESWKKTWEISKAEKWLENL